MHRARTAEAHQRAHVFEFDWHSPAFEGRLGAGDGVELPFVTSATRLDPDADSRAVWHGVR